MIKRLRLLLMAAVLCISFGAMAQTQVNWSGNVGTQTISSNTSVTLTGNVTLTGTITINNNVTLTINPGTGTTITRSGSVSFIIKGGATLKIVGTSAKRVILDGGAKYATANDARTTLQSGSSPARLIRCQGGVLDFAYTDVRNCCMMSGTPAVLNDGSAIAYEDTSGTATTNTSKFEMSEFMVAKHLWVP